MRWLHRASVWPIAASLFVGACGGDPPAPADAAKGAATVSAALGNDVVARVGDAAITRDQVVLVARAQRLTPRQALDALVHDALLAASAKATSVAGSIEVRGQVSALHAAALLGEVREMAAARGPVTDAELERVTAKHWVELDRPASARTVHAVVRFNDKTPEAEKANARAVAEEIRRRVVAELIADRSAAAPAGEGRAGTADPLSVKLRDVVASVDARETKVVVEELPPVTADGRVVSPGNSKFDPVFSKAASELTARGDVSPVIITPFGAHVIVLQARLEDRRLSAEERRAKVRDEVMTDRARELHAALLEPLRRSVVLDRNVDALLALVRVEADAGESASNGRAPEPQRGP